MTASTVPRMPAEFSDSLDLRLFQETRDQTPDHLRSTCPLHLQWRDRCKHLHGAGGSR